MDKLWAPWRSRYIYKRSKSRSCIFCNKANPERDFDNLIISRKTYSFSMLNIYPYNNGHIMVAPYRHLNDLSGLKEEELTDMMSHVLCSKRLLNKLLKPDGYNIGMNLGKVAGAGFEGHIHIHIVPRWLGDTNFMPVTSDTRVISESLKELYKRLKQLC